MSQTWPGAVPVIADARRLLRMLQPDASPSVQREIDVCLNNLDTLERSTALIMRQADGLLRSAATTARDFDKWRGE